MASVCFYTFGGESEGNMVYGKDSEVAAKRLNLSPAFTSK